jgi:hypothetical protein
MNYVTKQWLSKYLYCLLILLLGLLIGCAGMSQLKTSLGQEVSLRIGQTVQIKNEPLSIRFNGVTGDSRCPKGVQCFWAGEVKCDVTVTYQGTSSDITLTQHGGTAAYPQTYQDYIFSFSVEPYPEAGKQIKPEEYRLNLTVEKLPPGLH